MSACNLFISFVSKICFLAAWSSWNFLFNSFSFFWISISAFARELYREAP